MYTYVPVGVFLGNVFLCEKRVQTTLWVAVKVAAKYHGGLQTLNQMKETLYAKIVRVRE